MNDRCRFTAVFSFAALGALPFLLAATAVAGDAMKKPRFVAGDVAALQCRVVKAGAIHEDKPSSIVQIAVRNTGPSSAEPLVFEFVAGGQTVAVERVPEPHERRAGRAVPPKGETTYTLLAPVPPKAALKSTAVSVSKAAFFDGDASIVKPPIGVSRPRVENAEYTAVLGRYLKCSIVEIENRGERPLDLVFRGRFDQPKKVDSLLAYRAPVGKSKWVVEDVPMGPDMGSWGEPEVTKLELVDWCEIHGDVVPSREADIASVEATLLADPVGALAPRLREVWEAPYRYPATPVTLSGRFRLDNPGTDALWRGVKRVEGTFELRGFSGGRWTGQEIVCDPKTVPDALAKDLAAVVHDRFGMWFPRDPAAWPPLEEAFSSATVSGSSDRLEIDSGAIRRIDVKDGLPVRLSIEEGTRERRIEWTKAFGSTVARTIRTGDETLTSTWLDAGGGYVLPGRVELKGVFPEWGPETLEFSKWSVK